MLRVLFLKKLIQSYVDNFALGECSGASITLHSYSLLHFVPLEDLDPCSGVALFVSNEPCAWRHVTTLLEVRGLGKFCQAPVVEIALMATVANRRSHMFVDTLKDCHLKLFPSCDKSFECRLGWIIHEVAVNDLLNERFL